MILGSYTVKAPVIGVGNAVQLVLRAHRGQTVPLTKDQDEASVTESVLERIAAGDPNAVQECMDRYGGLVWSLARRSLSNPSDAEDLVQEVFADLWTNASRYDQSVAQEKTFIAMVARRRIIDRQRRERRRPTPEPLPDNPSEAAVATAGYLETSDEASRVAAFLEKLKPEQQQALELSIYHGLSHQSISDRLEVPLGTIKSHIRRGLNQVREMIARSDQSQFRGVEP